MISFQKFPTNAPATFSIMIPSWNNLDMLKLCIHAIRKNSEFPHDILVHVNEGIDGTAYWLQENQISYSYSSRNVGICEGINALRSLAQSNLLLYLNDDMYVCPGWDKVLLEEVKAIGHPYFFLSGTMLEPRDTGNNCVIAPCPYGNSINTFRETDLLREFNSYRFQDFCGTTWPPSLLHASLWDKVGGFSLEFSPGLYSDPDLCMKLWKEGVRYFKGLSACRVYHFMSKSTGRVKRNDGKKQFLKKWGFSASYFVNSILKRGQTFTGPLPDTKIRAPLKDKIKLMFMS